MTAKKRRNDVTTEIVVGAFMFTILVVLLTISLVISQNKLWEKKIFMEAVFPDVGGLKEGEGVYMRGVKIGNVNRIMVDDEGVGVRVRLRLTRDIRLHEDYSMSVQSSSMLGGMKLDILEGNRDKAVIPPENYLDLVGEPTPNLMNEVTETVQMIRRSLVDDGTLDNINALALNLKEISGQINQGKGTIGKLIQDEGLYQEASGLIADLRVAGENIQGISADARVISARLAAGKGSIGKLLSEDEALYNNLTNTLHQVSLASTDIRSIVDRVEKGEGTIGKLLSSDDAMYRDLRDTVASLKDFTKDLNEQNGTLGRLIRDDGVYVKVESLLDEVRATLDDFRETSPITTFASVFFGAF